MTSDRDRAERSAGDDSPADESTGESPVVETVQEVAKVASQESAPVLTDTVLDALFSDAVRDRFLHEAEAGLRSLIDSALDAIPDSASYGRLHQEADRAERQLRAMLQEAIYELFSGPARAQFQSHLEEASRRIAEGDTDGANDEVGVALQSLLSEVLKVLQSQWAQTLRLLLGISVKVLEATFTSHLKDAFGSITTRAQDEVEEKTEPFQEKIADRAKELRERLMETRDTMQERLSEARDRVQERLTEAVPGSATGSQRRNQLGAPPSRRPPPGPSVKRGPSRPPGGRPPSTSR